MLDRIDWRHAIVALILPELAGCDFDSAASREVLAIESTVQTSDDAEPPLREIASAAGMHVGAAADRLFRDDADGVQFKTVLRREFSVVTPENDLKHIRLRPSRDAFDFARADAIVEFARANGMLVRGHTLVWHHGNAGWLTARNWTPEEARALLTDHITTVVDHFKGRIVAWDVVNEALNENGTFRASIWSNLLGRDYLELAFRTAHAADPQALLFYNDFGIEALSAKSDSVYALVSRLLSTGVPIHGIGFQGHFRVDRLPSQDSVAANISRFAALGLKVHFTEVDIRLPQPSTSAQLRRQARNYRDLFDTCLQHVACDLFATWGLSDRDTWIPRSYPEWGEPLLFDSSYQPKPAYWSIHNSLSRGRWNRERTAELRSDK